MNTELVDGNLKAAIDQYQKVVQSGNRRLAAQALLHIAECYQKLGDAQTRTIYERVVKEYPEQTAAVATARLRLEDPNAAKAALQRQVWTGPRVDVYGSISPDGRVLSFVDWANNGALAIHDLTTGDDRTVEPGGEAEYSTISKDGKRIAYSCSPF